MLTISLEKYPWVGVDIMNRFHFLVLILFSLVSSCKEATSKETEYEVLSSFLKFSDSAYVDRNHIESLLYDVQSPTDTMGRAFRITKKLFLTNHHVIIKMLSGKYAQLVKQENRGFLRDRQGEFDIIHHDKKRDIALLRLKDAKPNQPKEAQNKKPHEEAQKKEESVPNDKVYFRLYPKVLSEKDKVSEFLRFDGNEIKHSGYYLKFGGVDLYNRKTYVKYVG